MTTYSRPLTGGTPTTGETVLAVHVNEPIDQIYDTILAGGITGDQIATGAVDTSELATEAVTRAKMDGTIPDASAMATSTAPTLDAQLANKKFVDDQVAGVAANDGSVKASVRFNGDDGTFSNGFNISSVVRNSVGNYTVTWDTNFANTDYAVVATCGELANTGFASIFAASVSSCSISTRQHESTLADYDIISVIAIGDQ